ncbi:MAG: hypothetical protein NTZ35_04040 [Ignavibacteriales bacterium]|nr:hypothetical protein [Ignavibacteriales bacterium]
MEVNITGTYEVADVKLTVTIGDAQLGYSHVYLDDTKLTSGPTITDFAVGKGTDLLGKILSVDTQVTVVSNKTNHTSVTNTMDGGKERKDFSGEATATKIGDTVDYHCSIRFTT